MIESLRITGIVLCVIIAGFAVASCFCGYLYRRVIAFIIGASFGMAIGTALNDIVFSLNNDFLVSLMNAFRFSQIINGEVSSSMIGITLKMLVIPIVCAVVFGSLGALFYRCVMSICCGVSFFAIALKLFEAYDSQVLFSALTATVTAGIIYFIYDWIFIVISAAIGAIVLNVISVELFDWGRGFLMYILFVMGLISQILIKYHHNED